MASNIKKAITMKKHIIRSLQISALAFGMSAAALATAKDTLSSQEQSFCFQINGDINSGTYVSKSFLEVNSLGVATGINCFSAIGEEPSVNLFCSPVNGSVKVTGSELFLSLIGNWQYTDKTDIVEEDTKVSVRYHTKTLQGQGVAVYNVAKAEQLPLRTASAEGSITRLKCPKGLKANASLPRLDAIRKVKPVPAPLGAYPTTAAPLPVCPGSPSPQTVALQSIPCVNLTTSASCLNPGYAYNVRLAKSIPAPQAQLCSWAYSTSGVGFCTYTQFCTY